MDTDMLIWIHFLFFVFKIKNSNNFCIRYKKLLEAYIEKVTVFKTIIKIMVSKFFYYV